jgi:carboxymethylenebutenolidase
MLALLAPAKCDRLEPTRVEFRTVDTRTTILVGYLFLPAIQSRAKIPAIVMMHGRSGAYSTLANGRFDESTLSQRHLPWGRLWAANGVAALLVDGFGPRGFAAGFPIHSNALRPKLVDEIVVRPGDAYAAAAYLSSRSDVDGDRIGLQGWSNGGSATLAAINEDIRLDIVGATGKFRAAVALYPGCGLHGRFEPDYSNYAPLRVFVGTDDEEISAKRCEQLIERANRAGSNALIDIYEGATHDFDDPGQKRQSLLPNQLARNAATRSILSFMLNNLTN